jgi:hypothetical protein
MTEIQLIIGLLALITAAELRVRRLVKVYLQELRPNSGSSIKDKVDKLSDRQDHIDGKIDSLITTLLSRK